MTHDSDATNEERIREKAHELWLMEGCPEGRAEAHWEMAREMLAREGGHGHAAQPGPTGNEAAPAAPPASKGEGDDAEPAAARPYAAR